jgi:hypothetical protein
MFKIHELVRIAYELVQNQSGDSQEHFVPVHKNLVLVQEDYRKLYSDTSLS